MVVSTGCGDSIGSHFKAFDIVPGIRFQIMHGEVVEEVLIVLGGKGRELLGHRRADQGGCVEIDRVVGAHQGGEAGKMVIVGMGLKDAVDFVHANAQSIQAVQDVRSGIEEVKLSLEHQHTGHGRPVDVPTIPFPRMDDPEIFPSDIMESKGIG